MEREYHIVFKESHNDVNTSENFKAENELAALLVFRANYPTAKFIYLMDNNWEIKKQLIDQKITNYVEIQY